MKKIKEFTLGALALVVMVVGIGFAGYIENHYSMTCTVGQYNNEVCFIDSMGEAWSDDRVSEYKLGDEVEVVFNTNYTDNTRLDDSIYKIK